MQNFILCLKIVQDIYVKNTLVVLAVSYMLTMLIIGFFLKRTVYNLAATKGHEPDTEADKLSYLIAILFVIGTILMAGILVFDYYGHSMAAASKSGLKNTNTSEFILEMGGFLGTFGDFFGGFINPILTFGTLIAIAVTILLQRVQLRDARSEASQNRQHSYIQAFETTFFHLLSLHAENVKNLIFHPDVVPANPTVIWARMHAGLDLLPSEPAVFGRQVFAKVLSVTRAASSRKISQIELYRFLQREHNEILGHYFRNLYQILNLIDRLSVERDEATRYKVRKGYSSFLRAQLSSYELAVLFLNCTFNTVDDGRFRDLLIWYKFLEHLPVSVNDDGELVAAGVEPNDQWIFFEYFDAKPANPSTWLPGAFGNNPAIKKFLSEQDRWEGPLPWWPGWPDPLKANVLKGASVPKATPSLLYRYWRMLKGGLSFRKFHPKTPHETEKL